MPDLSPAQPWNDIAPAPRTLFGHPPGLFILAATETWEKFSYFGMRALLVYYMIAHLAFTQQRASLVYGLYVATCYITPIAGGLLADRLIGRRLAVLLGGCIMALGHFLLAFEAYFYIALATIAIGNGLYLPSLSGQISGLYRQGDIRRASAFSIYYVSINLGAFLAPLVCGTLGELWGWHLGFGMAGIGMCVGVVIYALGYRHLPDTAPASTVRQEEMPADPKDFRNRIKMLGAVVLIVIFFRSAYEQAGNTLVLFTASGIDRSIMGVTVPMTWFQSLNPLLVFALTPLLVHLWKRQGKTGREPSMLRKMTFGAIIVASAFALLAFVATTMPGGRADLTWMLLFYGLYTLGELFILPLGLAMFGLFAPRSLAATTMAAWFATAFAGSLLAGAVGTLWTPLGPAAFFALMTAILLGAALALWALDRWAKTTFPTETGATA